MERDVKGFPISKAFTCMKLYEHLPLQTKTAILSIWLYCSMSNLYISHGFIYVPTYSFFEYSAACLSVILGNFLV